MPEEAVRWDTSPRKDDVPTLWEDSSDEYEEEHNTWNRGLGLFTLQGSSPKNTAVPERGGGVQDRTYAPPRAGRHLRVHGVMTKKKREARDGASATGKDV